MNCVGIDVSKGKSMIAVMRPLGELVIPPFEVGHTDAELCELSGMLGKLNGETRIVMEATGNYHLPVASFLYDSGFYVSVVNAMLVHGYGNNSLRRAKTDKKDAIKLANYGLDHWLALPRYIPEDEVRLMLKTTYRQYQQCAKVQTMLKNNLISLLDTAFPDANRLFASPARADGSEKWVDFVDAFPHCECVCGLSEKAFTAKYQKWCKKHGYNFSQDKALDIYASACGHFSVMPKTDTAKLLVEQAVSQLRAVSAALAALRNEMQSLAASLPEYPVVMGMFGVGPALGPQLMAEIGDVRRFHSKKALVAFAGIDGMHEEIVTQEEFDRAQAALREFSERAGWSCSNPLSKKVRCGICGHAMVREDVKHPYFFCRTFRMTGSFSCSGERVLESDIVEIILAGLHAQAVSAVRWGQIWEARHQKEKTDFKTIQKQITALKETCAQGDSQIKELYETLVSGDISKDEYRTAKAVLVSKRDHAKARIAELENALANADSEGKLNNPFVTSFQKYAEVTAITKEMMMDVLKEVRIYPGGRIEVIWNYREDLERLLRDLHSEGGQQDEPQTSMDLLQDCVS